MTIGGVRGFFRTQLNALKLKEWVDGFNIENIPSTVLNNSYHLDVGRITVGTPMGGNGFVYEFNYPVTLKVFSKGFKNPGLAIDAALDNAQDILADILQPGVRLALANQGLKDIRPSGITTQPLQISNDNAVILVMGFNAILVAEFKNN